MAIAQTSSVPPIWVTCTPKPIIGKTKFAKEQSPPDGLDVPRGAPVRRGGLYGKLAQQIIRCPDAQPSKLYAMQSISESKPQQEKLCQELATYPEPYRAVALMHLSHLYRSRGARDAAIVNLDLVRRSIACLKQVLIEHPGDLGVLRSIFFECARYCAHQNNDDTAWVYGEALLAAADILASDFRASGLAEGLLVLVKGRADGTQLTSAEAYLAQALAAAGHSDGQTGLLTQKIANLLGVVASRKRSDVSTETNVDAGADPQNG